MSPDDKAAVERALIQAEQATSSEFALIIAKASDEYRSIVLSCGLTLGSIAALLLWHCRGVTEFPLLLCVQLIFPVLMSMVPPLRHLTLRFTPAHLMKRRAAQRAAAEYLHLSHHLPPHSPIVLMYISLTERYVHIHTSRTVREKIPNTQWHEVVRTLTGAVKSQGLKNAVTGAITHAVDILKKDFPPQAGKLADAQIIEIGD
jgi:uncharacterized membrane protein